MDATIQTVSPLPSTPHCLPPPAISLPRSPLTAYPLSPHSPMTSRGDEVKTTVDSMVFQCFSENTALCIQKLLKLRIHMLRDGLPAVKGERKRREKSEV